MKILEHNCTTNEVIERDANAEEIAQQAIDEAQDVQAELNAVAKAQAKTALLERLGITADEAKLLLA
jgi:hypothetical protein